MTAPGIETFLTILRKSNLLNREQWRELTERVADRAQGGMPTADELGRMLIDLGWVTPWHIEHLRAGRSNFFLGRYKLLDQIGSGGMGAVFRAEQVGLHRIVALKLLAGEVGKDPGVLKRFHQEIQAVAAVDHPNVVAAFDADSVGDTHFLVMEYVAGKSLAEMLVERGPAPIGWACECIRQVAEGLQHAWERGLVHRDIKPSNLLVIPERTGSSANLAVTSAAPGPTIKILDLGLARVISEQGDDQGLTRTGQVLGTPDYISPEQAADTRKADIRSDLFSLGVTFHRLLTGELPFSGHSVMEKLMARATQTPPSVRAVRPEVPSEVAAIVLKLMERDPAQRFQTPREVARAVAPFCRDVSTTAWSKRDFERAPEGPGQPEEENEASTVVDQLLSRVATAVPVVAPASETPPKGDRSREKSVRALAGAIGPASVPRPSRNAGRQLSRLTSIRSKALLFGGILLVALGGLVWWFGGQGSPQPTRLVVTWPMDLRQGALLLVNGKEVSFGPESEIVWEGPPGTHRLRAVRPGFPAIDKTVTLKLGTSLRWAPDWDAAEQSWFTEMRQRIDSRRARLKSASSSAAAPTRDLMLSVLDRVPGNDDGRGLARDLATVRWPLDDLPATELSAEQALLLGQTSLNGATVGAESRQIATVFGDPRWRHAGPVSALAISTPTQTIISVGADDLVRLWGFDASLRAERPYQASDPRVVLSPQGDLALVLGGSAALLLAVPSGDPVASYPGVTTASGFSRDGDRFALGHPTEGVAFVSRQNTTSPRWLAHQLSGRIQSLGLSHDGTLLAVEAGGSISLLRTGGEVVAIPETAGGRAPIWHPSRPLLALQTPSADATLIDLSSTPPIVKLLEEAGEPLGFVADGTKLVTRRNQRSTLWEIDSQREERTLQDVTGIAIPLENSPGLVTGDDVFGWLRVRGFANGRDLSVPAHVGSLTALAVSDDDRWIVTGGVDGRLRVWNAETLAERVAAAPGVVTGCLTPDGRQLLLATDDGVIRVWDVAARQSIRTLVTGAREIREIRISPGGRFVAAIGDWGFFRVSPRVWDAASGTELVLDGEPAVGVRSLCFAGDGDRLVVLSEQGGVTAYTLPDGVPAAQLDLTQTRPVALTVSQRGDRLAILDAQGIAIWPLGAENVTRQPSQPGAASVEFGPWSDDLWLLAPAGLYRQTTSDKPAWKLQGTIAGAANAWSFDAPGDRIAIGSRTGNVVVLPTTGTATEPPTGTAAPLHRWVLARGPIRSLQFSAEGRHLLAVSSGGAAVILRLDADGPSATPPIE